MNTNYDIKNISVYPPKNIDKDEIKEKNEKLIEEIEELQNVMFAENKHSLLIILQGMDASGKDGLVKNVFSAVNPQGVRVAAFKKPTEEELAHDFLWRIHKHTPEKGMIQIFNRSHYEDVLVTRVMGVCDDKTAQKRFEIINNFETLLEMSGTKILKFYLHIDEEIQKERFKERIEDRRKNWKFNPADKESAKHWDEYRKYYMEVFENCGKDIPWTIVPAAKNWYKEYVFAKKIVETLKSLKMEYPKLAF